MPNTIQQNQLNSAQPKGLVYIFQTELWERFSYYGMTALLILYMSKFFNLSDSAVYALYGAYSALVYTTPIVGGMLSDRWLGPYRSVMLGGILIILGHFFMVLLDARHYFFFAGLSFIIVGTGFFKPNISTLLGQLYQANDPRREAGFTWAYLGSNIGTIIAPIITALFAVNISWNLSFGLAGVGMAIGLLVLWLGKHRLNQQALSKYRRITLSSFFLLTFSIVILLFLISFAMFYPWLVPFLLIIITVIAVALVWHVMQRSSQAQRLTILFVLVLIVFYVAFMVMLQQSGGMLNLFTERNVNRYLWGWHVPTGMFQSVEPLAVVILGPMYTWLWARLAQRNIQFDYPLQFFFALVGMSVAFIILLVGVRYVDANGLISMWWINASYIMQAAAELFIGPIGLAMLVSLVPKRFIGVFMGIWVLASAFANFIAAKVGAWMSPVHGQVDMHIASQSIHVYAAMLDKLTIFVVSCALLLWFVRGWLLKLAAIKVAHK